MRRRIPMILLLSLVLGQLAATAGAAAGQASDLTPGVRVRVRPPNFSEPIDGVVLSTSADSLVVSTPTGVHHHLSLASLPSIDFFRGHSRSAGAKTGALWGLGIGSALGVVSLGFAGASDGPVSTRGEIALIAYALTGYATFGALIGTAVGGDEWSSARIGAPAGGRERESRASTNNGWRSTTSGRVSLGLRVPAAF